MIRPGTYRHFKGKLYQVYAAAEHVDTAERYVIYRPLYGHRKLTVRNYDEFLGEVTRDGRTMTRFEFVSDDLPLGADLSVAPEPERPSE